MGYHKSFTTRTFATMVGAIATSGSRNAGTVHTVKTTQNTVYVIYSDNLDDIVYRKSTDGGASFGTPVVVVVGVSTNLAVWYDGWSGLAGGLIHIATNESGADDVVYRTIDTANSDALSTETVIFDGASSAIGGSLSICRTRGGNVLCRAVIDAAAEGGFFKLANADVPNGAWGAALTINEALASGDQAILLPGFAADNQDAMLIFWDASANEISRQNYDDSANTWAETSIATSMTELAEGTAGQNFAAAVDTANSQIILAAWSATDTLNADLRCWKITDSAITEVTNVVLNSTDDQGLCAVAIDTPSVYWYVFYCGASNGSETWNTAVKVYYKVSTDGGTTWGSETLLVPNMNAIHVRGLMTCPRFTGTFATAFLDQLTWGWSVTASI